MDKPRLVFIDNIRWVMIALVICHHAAVTYSHVGGWYYLEGPKPDRVTTMLLAMFETVNQAYFMGLLFLLAGYFVPRALDTKGSLVFLRDRALRLGIPSLFYMFVIHPVTVYWLLHKFENPQIPSLTQAYVPFVTSGKVWVSFGPMWFAVALLFFCIVYAVVAPSTKATTIVLPDNKAVIALIAVMGTCSFLVRIKEPVGTTILNMLPCYFSQYILLFIVGIRAYRGDWLRRIPYAFGMFWLKLALRFGLISLLAIILTSGALHGDTQSLLGGFTLSSALFSFWEAFFCLGMCLGLIVLFRERYNYQGRLAAWLSQNNFSTYLFHPLILVAVTLCLRPLVAPVLVKFVIATIIAIPLAFAISGLIRTKIPGLSRLL